MRTRLTGLAVLLAATAYAAEPAKEARLIEQPDAFKTLVNPNCSHCRDEAKRRAGELKDSDPVLCWIRGKYDGGAIPLRFFLSPYRVISDTYGVFVYDADAGYARGYEPSLDFRFHGWRNGVMVMKHKDGTLYSCLSGVAFAGPKKGERLRPIPTLRSDWGFWLKQYPGTVAYHMFDKYKPVELPATSSEGSKKSRGPVDARLPADTPVLGVRSGEDSRAYPLAALEKAGLIRDKINGEDGVVLWYGPTRTAVAYRPVARPAKKDDGAPRALTLTNEAKKSTAPFVDKETGSHWDIAGRAVDGELKGWALDWLDSVQVKWFAWAAEYPRTTVASLVQAEPAPRWEAKFADKKGWIGGDGVYSVVLGPRRVLWLFGDTLLGEVKAGGRAGAAMVNNTIGVQCGHGESDAIRFVAGKTKDDKPSALFIPADGKGWFWPQDAIRVGDRLLVFLAQLDRTTAGGAFGFRPLGQWLAVVENPDDEPETWRVKQQQLPFADFGRGRARSWGSAVLADSHYLYVYGYTERGEGLGRRRLTLARVPADRPEDFSTWRFRTAEGWSEKAAAAAELADGLATEFSVSRRPHGKGYVLVYTENGLGARIVGRFADAPQGPWSAPLLLYKCPEMARDKGVFNYAAKAHPWATSGNELLISYCVNTWEFARLFRDEAVYRPKFVRVKLLPTK